MHSVFTSAFAIRYSFCDLRHEEVPSSNPSALGFNRMSKFAVILPAAGKSSRFATQQSKKKVFVELKGHAGILDDIRRVADAVTIPCMVNIDAGGPLAALHTDHLHTHGIALAIYPALLRNALGFAMRDALQHLRQDGSTTAMRPRMLSSQEYNDCLGLPEVEQWEARFPE